MIQSSLDRPLCIKYADVSGSSNLLLQSTTINLNLPLSCGHLKGDINSDLIVVMLAVEIIVALVKILIELQRKSQKEVRLGKVLALLRDTKSCCIPDKDKGTVSHVVAQNVWSHPNTEFSTSREI